MTEINLLNRNRNLVYFEHNTLFNPVAMGNEQLRVYSAVDEMQVHLVQHPV